MGRCNKKMVGSDDLGLIDIKCFQVIGKIYVSLEY